MFGINRANCCTADHDRDLITTVGFRMLNWSQTTFTLNSSSHEKTAHVCGLPYGRTGPP
jgi:hypothetical protein